MSEDAVERERLRIAEYWNTELSKSFRGTLALALLVMVVSAIVLSSTRVTISFYGEESVFYPSSALFVTSFSIFMLSLVAVGVLALRFFVAPVSSVFGAPDTDVDTEAALRKRQLEAVQKRSRQRERALNYATVFLMLAFLVFVGSLLRLWVVSGRLFY
ncbi:hypothetical protein IHV25_09450 [Phaeovibrio sulfidiphilus]|uniref:Transmembrane protein n=1 Tax=Phaeovibrio sulfidiphilus TaxID=1220600 RepID=A0A8J6YR48_9PROT|nr:hypothetical protein [Phaeovibrio sulfidiphilus]MBE1237867.1 hypothetical protein [Phaeovibrio sulfidiphilus]